MSDFLQMLLLNGFLIYPSNGKFVVRKERVPDSDYALDPSEFGSYGEAFEYAVAVISKPRKRVWCVLMRYNRGLGVEYRSLSEVFACEHEEAMALANQEVEELSKKMKLLSFEVRATLKK